MWNKYQLVQLNFQSWYRSKALNEKTISSHCRIGNMSACIASFFALNLKKDETKCLNPPSRIWGPKMSDESVDLHSSIYGDNASWDREVKVQWLVGVVFVWGSLKVMLIKKWILLRQRLVPSWTTNKKQTKQANVHYTYVQKFVG